MKNLFYILILLGSAGAAEVGLAAAKAKPKAPLASQEIEDILKKVSTQPGGTDTANKLRMAIAEGAQSELLRQGAIGNANSSIVDAIAEAEAKLKTHLEAVALAKLEPYEQRLRKAGADATGLSNSANAKLAELVAKSAALKQQMVAAEARKEQIKTEIDGIASKKLTDAMKNMDDAMKNIHDAVKNAAQDRLNQLKAELKALDEALDDKKRKQADEQALREAAARSAETALNLENPTFAKMEKERLKYAAELDAAVSEEVGKDKNTQMAAMMGKEFRDITSDPARIAKLVVGVAAMVGLAYALKKAGDIGAEQVKKMLNKPNLVKESSRDTPYNAAKNWVLGKKRKVTPLDDMVLPGDLKQQFGDIVDLTKQANKTGLSYTNVLFYGPPGTGKTFGAKIIAEQSGLNWDIIAGSSFTQFAEGEDVRALDELFRWAQKSEKGVVVFIDEADSFLARRTGQNPRMDNLVNFFLSFVERASNDKIMFIFATNHPERLDPAVLSRIGSKVYFPLPGKEERRKQLDVNMKRQLLAKGFTLAPEAESMLDRVADKMDGFSGRAILNFVVQCTNSLVLRKEKVLSREIFEVILHRAIEQQKAETALQKSLGDGKGPTYFNPNAVK